MQQASRRQIIVRPGLGWLQGGVEIEIMVIDGRIYDSCGSPVDPADLLGDKAGDRQEHIRILRRFKIPAFQVIECRSKEGFEYRIREIGIDLPGIAQGRIAIADMERPVWIANPFGISRAVGNNQIVLRSDLQAPDRKRHQRDKKPVMAPGKREIQDAGFADFVLKVRRSSLRTV